MVHEITTVPPSRLLLATDLSARCDRALDRAAQLANEWRAELVALNVLDVTAAPDQTLAWATGRDDEQLLQVARRQLVRDLAGLDIQASMRTIRSDDAAATIRETAISTGAGLVVTGVARNEVFGRFLLGSTVQRLARMLPQPLLVVRNRGRLPYRRIIVTSDFSASSRHALQLAAYFFPERELILYHACEIPFSGGLSDKRPPATVSLDIEQGEYRDFLATSQLPAGVTVRPVIELGPLEVTLTQYVRQHDIDLVVMGTHGRSKLMHILLGSMAAKLLDWLPCDALVVREPESAS
jgi:nucleotide-binding universal stress UspA family protein